MKWVSRIFMVCGLLSGVADALYQDQYITAARVAERKLVIDGKPDLIWKEIGGRGYYSQIAFSDYEKIVILEPDSVRNAHPSRYYEAPGSGSVTMLAAYDSLYLYFFFIVKENNRFNQTPSCSMADLWRAHAVDVFVDPAAWSTSVYPTYFSADAGEVSYGTSTKTFQVSKPAFPGEIREYYRDRTVGNRFQLRTLVSELEGVSAVRTSADANTYGVELRVPIPAAHRADYVDGKSMFISWGYNHYPDGPRATCGENPIAYRWAKHYRTYSAGEPKPPGWRAGDSTHYDPLRSRDGWGRLELSNQTVHTGIRCRAGLAETDWDLGAWRTYCGEVATSTAILPAARNRPSARFLGPVSGEESGRDISGRLAPGGPIRFRVFPDPALPGRKDGMEPLRLN